MTVTLIALALLLAVFVGWLLKHSFNTQPWVASGAHGGAVPEMPSFFTVPRVGLAVFLAVVTSVFALAISAYVMRMAASPYWEFLPQPDAIWINTGLLVLGSVGLEAARRAAGRRQPTLLRLGLAVGVLAIVGFMLGQYLVWGQLNAAGYYLTSNPASAFFVIMTALHVVHLAGGLAVLMAGLRRLRRGGTPAQVRESVGLCAVYFHYLLFVWIVLFGVLFVGALPLYELCRSGW